ncbi:unnamed protein product, partial [Aureobasidium uvarum]
MLQVDTPATQLCDVVKITLLGKLGSCPPSYGITIMTLASFQCREAMSRPIRTSSVTTSREFTELLLECREVLKAHVYYNNVLVAETSQPVQLFPSVPSTPPPVGFDDFGGEYIMENLRRTSKLLTKRDSLQLVLTEPKPLSLWDDEQSRLLEIPMTCRLQHIAKDVPIVCAKISWRLKTCTTVSTIPLPCAPTSRQTMHCSFLGDVISRSPERSTDVRWVDWVPCSDVSDGWNWIKTDNVWLSIPQPRDSVPSFFNLLVCRRYSLELSI